MVCGPGSSCQSVGKGLRALTLGLALALGNQAQAEAGLTPNPDSVSLLTCQTLVIDYFEPTSQEPEPHGVKVSLAADSTGSGSPAIRQSFSENRSGRLFDGRRDYFSAMSESDLDQGSAHQAIGTYIQRRAAVYYNETATEIGFGVAPQLEYSSLNLSVALTKAELTETLYGEAAFAWRMD